MSDLRYLLQHEIDWLIAHGVSAIDLIYPDPIQAAHGHRCPQGYFDFDPEGPRWFVFPQPKGGVFWCPETGELASEWGDVFALGEMWIINPGSTALGQSLPIFANPVSWLQHRRFGLVVLKWTWAFEQLRDVPRIAVDERVARLYRRHMKPRSMPVVSIMRTKEERYEAA